jgi:hypothetical protein
MQALNFIVVRPGGDASDIILQFTGQDSMRVDVDGLLKTYLDEWIVGLPKGTVYQQDGTELVAIPWLANWDHAHGTIQAQLELGDYNHSLPLIIDICPGGPPGAGGGGGGNYPPEWSSYVATPGGDGVFGLDTDPEGNVYFTGYSTSNNVLPVTPGLQNYNAGGDLIVGRFNSNYEVEALGTWMTYFGGVNSEVGEAIVYDAITARVTVGGKAESDASFPPIPLNSNPNCFQEAQGRCLLAFFNAASGEAQYFTRIHASPFSKSYLNDVDVDAAGNVFFVGYSEVAQLDVVDPPGTADYFASGLPENDPLYQYDAFVGKLTTQANLTWSFALGGPEPDYGYACHVDREHKKLYVVGATRSKNEVGTPDGSTGSEETEFPLVNAGGWYQNKLNGTPQLQGKYDGFITCFDLLTLGMVWSSFLGGAGDDDAITDVTTDLLGNIYITGFTNTAYFSDGDPCTWVSSENGMPDCNLDGGYHQPTFGGGSYDNFIAKFDPFFSLRSFTWVGGHLNEAHETPVTYERPRLTNYHTVEQQGPIILFSSTRSGNEGQNIDPPMPMVANPLYYQQDWHHDAGNNTPEETDAYLAIFSTTGTPLATTYFGGKGSDFPGAVTSTEARVYISGRTLSPTEFPLGVPWMPPPLNPYWDWSSECSNSIHDGYIAQLEYDLVSIGVSELGNMAVGTNLMATPNPSDGTLTVILPEARGTLEVYDPIGRLVLQTVPDNKLIGLDLTGLASGTYVLFFKGLNTVETARLVKR